MFIDIILKLLLLEKVVASGVEYNIYYIFVFYQMFEIFFIQSNGDD